MAVHIKLLEPGDEAVLTRVADGVFDDAVDPKLTKEFLADPHHHIAVAIEDGIVVGFASGVDYIHPDKPRELFINEVGVSPAHHRRGLGTKVLEALLDRARASGCVAAWVLTDHDNEPARALYTSTGAGPLGQGDTLGFEFKLR